MIDGGRKNGVIQEIKMPSKTARRTIPILVLGMACALALAYWPPKNQSDPAGKRIPVLGPGGGIEFAEANGQPPFEFEGRTAPPVVGEFSGKECTIEAVFKNFSMLDEAQAIVSSAREQFAHVQVHHARKVTIYTDAGDISLGILVPSTNQWHHLALKIKSGDTALYLDGRLLHRSAKEFKQIIPTEALRIGRGFDEQRPFVGTIRSMAIYPEALDDAAIARLYTQAARGWTFPRGHFRKPTVLETLALAILATLAARHFLDPAKLRPAPRLGFFLKPLATGLGTFTGLAILTISATGVIRRETERRDYLTFCQEANATLELFDQRMSAFAHALEGVRDLFVYNAEVTEAMWENYVWNMNPGGHFRGYEELGYLRMIDPAKLADEEERARRAKGLPDFKFLLNPNAPFHAAHLFHYYVGAQKGQTQPTAFVEMGHDADEELWEPLERAGANRDFCSSEVMKVGVSQGTGFAIVLPVYKYTAEGQIHDGFVYGKVDLRKVAAAEREPAWTDLRLKVYIGQAPSPENMVLSFARRERTSDERPRFSATWRRDPYPRRFLTFESTPQFDGRSLAFWPAYVFWSGLAASALAGGLAYLVSQARLKDAAVRDELRRANADLVAALRERENMSRDLHDGALQSVYAIGLQLQHCRTALKRDAKNGDALMGSALQGLNQLVTELRGMLVRKDPQSARPATLPMALREIADRLLDVGSAKIDIDIDENAARSLTIEESAHTLQIAREALGNSLRHGGAQTVVVRLASGVGGLRLSIADDGAGFATTADCGVGHGLRNMRARAQEIDAQFQIESQPGAGTSILMIYRARIESGAPTERPA